MPPVAKKWDLFEEGTPHRALQEAVLARYVDGPEFFRAVAREVGVSVSSTKSNFHGILKGTRPLPAAQQAAYLKLLTITPDVLEALDAARNISTPKRRDRLEELEDDVTLFRTTVNREFAELRARVRTLEDQRAAAPSAAKRPRGRKSAG